VDLAVLEKAQFRWLENVIVNLDISLLYDEAFAELKANLFWGQHIGKG
jgi:hypothetical protein